MHVIIYWLHIILGGFITTIDKLINATVNYYFLHHYFNRKKVNDHEN